MAKIPILFWHFLSRLLSKHKLGLFCFMCYLLLTITAVVQYFIPSLHGNVKQQYASVQKQINLNYNGTTDIFPHVVEATLKIFNQKFSNEEARILGLPVVSRTLQNRQIDSSKIIYLATEYFSEWNPSHYYFPHIGSKTFNRYPCPVSDCIVTKEPEDITKADAVLFHVRDLVIYKFPKYRSEKQVWILYSMEPPWLELLDMRRFNGMFNWTMSYRNGSDVMVKYGFIGRRPIPSPNRKSLIGEKSFNKKEDKAVWYASNCCTDSKREIYIAELKKYFPIDVFGGCGNEGCRPAETSTCYKKIERKYKFYMSFENAICQNYVTEKLYNILEYRLIPVVFGGVDYKNSMPQNSVINALDFRGPQELATYLWSVSRNITLYRSYFKWKVTYRSYLHPWMCDLCEKLYSQSVSTSVKHDLVSWWHEEFTCKRWTGNSLKTVDPNNYSFPCYHTKLFQ